jgi:aminoglycoside phosphotransferase (APT) family kinase protein
MSDTTPLKTRFLVPPWRQSSDSKSSKSGASLEQGVDVPLDRDWAQAYFSHKMADRGILESVELSRMARGVSRESWEAKLRWADGSDDRLVVRRDAAGVSADGMPLEREFAIYDALQKTPVPVAPVLWFENDERWQPGGRSFYIRGWVEGSWDVPNAENPDPAFDEWRIELCKEHVRALAKVHMLDWQALGFGNFLEAPRSTESAALDLIEQFEARVRKYAFHSYPLAMEAIRVLKHHAPRTASTVCLCKGTNGLGEEVWVDGKIVAMSDWELAAITDPAYDFCQLQNLVPNITGKWGWNETLEYYKSLTGTEVKFETIDFYNAICGIQQLAYTLNAGRVVHERMDDQIRYCWVGSEVLQYSVARLAWAANLLGEGN